MTKRIALLLLPIMLLLLLFSASAFAESADAVQVSYLGPEGTYTEEAARFWFCSGETLNPRATVNDAIADLLSGDADFAVIPQENTLGGAVVNYVDALIAADHACVVGEVVLPINQTLMGVPGATIEDIQTVCSHAQGLTQSAAWRSEHLPDAGTVEMSSTAAAASYVAEQGNQSIAAVAAPGAAPLYGLEVLAENVQITDANKTRFYVLSKRPLETEGLTRAVFVATCDGSRIDDILAAMRDVGLEIVSLHDRPEGSRLGRYHYVIEAEDAEGITDAQVRTISALEGVRFAGRFNAAESSAAESSAAKTVIAGWSEDSPAMQSIVEFVEASGDESSEGYIPKQDRIAVFDMDGTLYGERFPTYFNDWLYIQRALYDESFEAPEELKAFAQAWEDKVLRGIPIEDFDAKERELGPKLYEGLTPEEYCEVVRSFKQLPVRGFEGMTYGEAFFQPMVSLVKYLYDNDYTVYIVSATYRDAVRVMTEGVLDAYIPRDHVIGTDLLYTASGDADKDSMFYELTPEDELVIAGELFLKNQKTNKAAMIQQEIGRMPVLAFGNSTGDFSMATYTLQNEKYGGRAYMLLCDDTERDYGSPETAASFKEKCDANGFYTVSMRDEFSTIYGDGVKKTEQQESGQEPALLSKYWTEGSTAAEDLNAYLRDVTDASSPDFIPVEDRIAVFDLDGTLMCETYPFCFEYMVFSDYVLNHADEMPEEVVAVAQEIADAAGKEKPAGMSTRQAAAGAVAYQGMSMSEIAEMVRSFKESEAWGFDGLTRGEAFYKPMTELFDTLLENDFTVYIVTATERNIVRELIKGTLAIPPSHVIGTEYGYTATAQGEKADADYTFGPSDQIVFDGSYMGENAKTSKVDAIVREIGQQPVLAFGNSSGDVAMEIYTISNNPYKSAAYMVVADDEAREYGDAAGADEKKESYTKQGIGIISMRDDFKTIYGDGVQKTALPGVEETPEKAADDDTATADEEQAYTLDEVVVLSRHNIRSPLSGSGSLLGDITPHKWFDWTSNPSELSLRGAMLETQMGQYFRLWLEDEGLFPENYRPEDGAVRFYANAKQRTQATARYFSAGLLPVAAVPVESHAEYDTMDPTFNPVLTFCNDEYAEDAVAQIAEKGGKAGLESIHDRLTDAIELLMDVTDMDESEAYRSGKFGDLLADGTAIKLELGKEPGMTGPIKTATSVADALTFQYYEMADDKAAAFGHDLTREDWLKIHSIVDTYTGTLFESPLVAVNVAHPLLQEILSEMTTEGRKFSFLCGHDSNVASVLAALGVEEYELPDTVEPKTPIGVKLVFETWSSEDGEAYAKVRLVYQSTEQLRGIMPLSLDKPPVSFDIDLPGLERNADGYYRLDDVLDCLQNAVDAYDELIQTYSEDVEFAAAA